jgi:CheY-like chemotaxis protein
MSFPATLCLGVLVVNSTSDFFAMRRLCAGKLLASIIWEQAEILKTEPGNRLPGRFIKSGMGKTPYFLRHVFQLTVRNMTDILTDKTTTQAGVPASAPLHCQTNPRRILMVEDDCDIRQINAMVLHHAGYYVDTAEDGVFAWEALGASRYDLMITDNKMPHLTGMDLLKKLHATRKALPFIMATGEIPEKEFTQYPWIQPTATLLKPYTVEELLGAVQTALRTIDGARVKISTPYWPSALTIACLERFAGCKLSAMPECRS